jgi:hypothetical protein
VHQVSVAQSLGNIVYTTAILSFFKDNQDSKKAFPKEFVSQSAIAACFRAVLIESKTHSEPPVVEYKKFETTQKYIRIGQQELIKIIKRNQEEVIGPKKQLWAYLPKSSSTFDGSARVYHTNFKNNLWMHASKRLKTVCRSYLANVLYRKIVGAQFVTDVNQYKNTEQIMTHAVPFLERQDMKDLVTVHQQ